MEPGDQYIQSRVVGQALVVRFVSVDILFTQTLIEDVGQQIVAALKESGCRSLVLNMQPISYVSSLFLGKLVGLKRRLAPEGGKVTLCHVGPLVHDVLESTHLDRLFEIEQSEELAIAQIVKHIETAEHPRPGQGPS